MKVVNAIFEFLNVIQTCLTPSCRQTHANKNILTETYSVDEHKQTDVMKLKKNDACLKKWSSAAFRYVL